MKIEELEALKKDNAIKAKSILESDGPVEDAQKLLDDNAIIDSKIEALKSASEQLLPVAEVKEVKMESKIEFKTPVSYKNLPFSGSNEEKGRKAYAWGRFAKAITGDKASQDWLKEHTSYKAASEGTNSAGGFMVPDELLAELIFLRDQYGVVRRNARVIGMNSDTLWVPKNSASASVYWPGENSAITESSPTFARVEVLAKKMGILSQVSSELNEDSLVEIGAALAQDMAWRVSNEEDRVCFNGSSATAADGNINGFITEVNGVASNVGLVAGASGSAGNWNAFTRANFRSVVSKLPLYADIPGQVKWYMSRQCFNDVVCSVILDAASGNSNTDLMNFNNGQPSLFGYPVEFSQHMQTASAGSNNTPAVAFGNLQTGAVLGDRRDFNVKVSEHYYFNQDALAFRGTTRIGFTCHDPGTSSAAGSIILLRRTT